MKPNLKTLFVALAFSAAVAAGASNEIVVTSGKFQGAASVSGTATIVERNEKRYVDFKWSKAPAKTVSFRLVKKESLAVGKFPQAEFVELGKSPKAVEVPKKLDVWLYRSVAAVDANGNVLAFVNLRSAQEKGR